MGSPDDEQRRSSGRAPLSADSDVMPAAIKGRPVFGTEMLGSWVSNFGINGLAMNEDILMRAREG